jgi:hypothetical protein
MPLSPIPSTLPTSTYEHLVLEALGEIAVGSTINYNPPILDTALFRHLVLNALQYIANNPGGGGSGTVTSITAGTGLTGGTITTSGTIAIDSTVVVKDANNNISANAFFNNLATITASGTQVVLTAASAPVSLVTGSGGQTIKLPNATTLTKGTIFSFNNNQTSGAISVNNNSNTLIASIPSGGYVTVVLLDNATAAGSWDRHDQSPSNVSWSTNTFDYPGSITSATWNGNTVAANRGGTGQSAAFVAGGIAYGSSTSALGVTPIGTTGQVLTSAGAGTPTWTTPTIITSGSVDNAVLRANGTGGTTLQNSGLIIEDAIESFAVTGVASTDIITATGSAFVNGQPVRFTALTGGAGLVTTTNYYVINVSGTSFQVSTSVGGAASLFTTDITSGTLLNGHSPSPNVSISQNTTATNSDLVLTPKGTGALVAGPRPNGATSGGDARGTNATDLQTSRSNTSQVAGGTNSVICGGQNNRNTGAYSVVGGGSNNTNLSNFSVICGGESNSTASAYGGFLGVICGGSFNSNTSRQAFVGGGCKNNISADSGVICGGGAQGNNSGNNVSGAFGAILGGNGGKADRYGMQAHASGQFSNVYPFSGGIGDAQRSRFVLRCKTTTNTGVEMALDGATTYLGIPSGKVIAMTINISGVKSDGTAVAHYVRQYAVKNVAGTSSQVYAPVTIGSDNATGTTIDLSANDADDTLRLLVTGIASETWRWVASFDAVEIIYGL